MKITQTDKGGIITWGKEDWLSGLDPAYPNIFTPNQNSIALMAALDPYRKLGYATPSSISTDLTNVSVATQLQVNATVTGVNAYTVQSTAGRINRVPLIGTTITNDTGTTGYPHTIDHAHANELGTDIVTYTAMIGSASAVRVFYSFYDDTDWDVGVVDDLTTTLNTFNDDFMSTIPATPLASPYLAGGAGFPHPMKVGADDILYIGDRNFVHAYDGQTGANGTFSPAVLTLPEGYVITGFARIDPRSLVVFAYLNNASASSSTNGFYLSQATAFFWDYLSLDPYSVIDLNDNTVGAPFEWKGTIGCFTSGRIVSGFTPTKDSRLQIYNGSVFETVFNYIGNVPAVGGVDIKDNQIQWNSEGTIYSYGNNLGEKSVPNIIGKGTGSGNGLLKSMSTILQMVSSGATTSGGLQNLINGSFNSAASIFGAMAKPAFPMRYHGQVKRVRLQLFNTTTSAGLALNIALHDQENTASTVFATQTTFAQTTVEKEYNSNGTPLPAFDRIQPRFTWSAGGGSSYAPVVEELSIEYENKIITNA